VPFYPHLTGVITKFRALPRLPVHGNIPGQDGFRVRRLEAGPGRRLVREEPIPPGWLPRSPPTHRWDNCPRMEEPFLGAG
jgi:hypothetical protein